MAYKFNRKQLQALSMLASGTSSRCITRELKLRRETIGRWRQIPEFMQEYDRLMGEARFGLKNKMTEMMNATIERIIYEIDVGNEPKRIENFLNVLKTLEKNYDNEKS